MAKEADVKFKVHIFLKSGPVISAEFTTFEVTGPFESLRWEQSDSCRPRLLRVRIEEIAAVTYDRP